jgi:hypothetical protein
MAKKFLTNERLKVKFKSNFALANFAIKTGRECVLSGKFSTLDELINDIRRKAEMAEAEAEDRAAGRE